MATRKKPNEQLDPFTRSEAARVRSLGNMRDTSKSTAPMPKTKRFLGASDVGEAQRISGLKQAGKFFGGSLGVPMQKRLTAESATKKSKGGKATKK